MNDHPPANTPFHLNLIPDNEAQFAPQQNLDGKNNYTVCLLIDEWGITHKVVRLNFLDDRYRERIVALHFMKQYIYNKGYSYNSCNLDLVSRDSPWDFSFRDPDGSEVNFEICRIGEKNFLRALKAENDARKIIKKKIIKGYEILKIEKHFPGTFPQEDVANAATKGGKKKDFRNVLRGPIMFIRPTIPINSNLEEMVISALSKKAEKNHRGKANTVIVIDNLTMKRYPYELVRPSDYLEDFLNSLPFPSVWVYTGYYSDNDGYNCEFSMLQLK